MCNAIEIEYYYEWLAVSNCNNYNGDKAILFPNPTTGSAYINLVQDYIDACGITAVEYELYNSNGDLLTTINPVNVDDVVQIPATFTNTVGTYLIFVSILKCVLLRLDLLFLCRILLPTEQLYQLTRH
ncbi:MAG: hypothetical protein FWG85_03345 [Bacteroidetes bacterium]|nr:hypothetical protein [Bacteroidota bacterium]